MDKKKQIEEMAKYLLDDEFDFMLTKTDAFVISRYILKKYQPKIPEGAVVISKEQNENWLSFLEQNIEKARKEAVEKFVELLLSEYEAFEEEDEILIKDMRGDIQDVAKALIGGEYAERTI